MVDGYERHDGVRRPNAEKCQDHENVELFRKKSKTNINNFNDELKSINGLACLEDLNFNFVRPLISVMVDTRVGKIKVKGRIKAETRKKRFFSLIKRKLDLISIVHKKFDYIVEQYGLNSDVFFNEKRYTSGISKKRNGRHGISTDEDWNSSSIEKNNLIISHYVGGLRWG